MKVSVFGTGYVGLVAGACFAESGNDVICLDIDEGRIQDLINGIVPIYEPGLEEMIKRNVQQRRLSFSTSFEEGVENSLFMFIAVGTPPGADGSADLQYVLTAAESIGTYMNDYKIVVNKSTVPVGTADLVRNKIQETIDSGKQQFEFDVVSNPEFLREGAAIKDFMEPDRVVIGADNSRTTALMKELYQPFMSGKDRMLLMDVRSAEMTKYAANSMLATKISFINEIAKLCEQVGANVDQVRAAIGSDSRIGPSFLFPGIGYGGSCFPKDVQALIETGNQNNSPMDLLRAVEAVNGKQKNYLLSLIKQVCGDKISGSRFGVWGLSFKPQTDDMREAPSRVIIDGLLQMGAQVIANDPAAMKEAKRIWGDKIEYQEYYYDVLDGADALLILTEWNDYRHPDFDRIKSLLKQPLIFDGRNIFDPQNMSKAGFHYYSIGRPYLDPS